MRIERESSLKFYILTFTLIFSCAGLSQDSELVDPLEDLNRKFYIFNFEVVDPLLLEPLARSYEKLTPDFTKKLVNNFFSNLDDIPSAANHLLQGKISRSVDLTVRFLINSSLGMAGLFDVATKLNVKGYESEDFGQPLAVWGVSSGPYLMLPLYGPSTLRDAPSNFFDSLLDPFTYNNNYGARVGLKMIDIVAVRADLLGVDEMMSGDGYLFVRDIYLQTREYEIKDGNLDDAFDDFGDYEDFEEYDDYY